MTKNKDLKRVVRDRMRKTGEAYTAARAQILKKRTTQKRTAKQVAASAVQANNFAAIAGMPGDEAIREKTGRTWEEWVRTLDAHDATKMRHRDVAVLVNEKYGVDGWWSQSVTVGYERIKGLRAPGQRLNGTYETNKSRTYNVPVETLFDAWNDASTRNRWLDAAGVKVRTATVHKSMRLGWSDGSIVAVGFMSKGKTKSAVALGHTKLPDKATADRLKKYWTERLDALGVLFANE
jgi:hypothetical protein